MAATATLQRQPFRTSRLLEYFSEKELTLQTGHERDRWPEVIVKELVDNALDAAEEAGVLPEIHVTIADGAIRVEDNGPGLPAAVLQGVPISGCASALRTHTSARPAARRGTR